MRTLYFVPSFLFSIALHLVAIWCLWGPSRRLETPVQVQLEVIETPARVVKAVPSQSGPTTGRGRPVRKRNLFPSSSPLTQPETHSTRETVIGDALVDRHQYNEALTDMFGDNQEWPFLKYLHQKVEENLSFDARLAEWNHFGTVYIEFWVDYQGNLVANKLRVVAEDPILKVHSLKALRRALADSFEPTKWNPSKESIRVHAKFDYLSGTSTVEKQRVFSKRQLVFQRRTQRKRIPTEFWGQVADGGIHTDLVVMYEKWKKYNHKKTQIYTGFDPFEDYRRDPDFNL